jgi:hypothetical protein
MGSFKRNNNISKNYNFTLYLKVKISAQLSLYLRNYYAIRRIWEWQYSSTHSWTRHYIEVCGQLHAPVALPPM